MPVRIHNISKYQCTKCTYGTYDEMLINSHILDNLCKNGSTSYYERKVTD